MSALLDSRECDLLIGRLEVLGSRRNPNLDRVYGIALRCIPLAMDDAAAGRHRLDFVGPQNVALTCTVSVLQAAFEHVSDDLHVAVSVWSESFAWSDTIIIQNPQHTKIRIGRIVIIAKGERIKSLEPAAICLSPILTVTNGDHFPASPYLLPSSFRTILAPSTSAFSFILATMRGSGFMPQSLLK